MDSSRSLRLGAAAAPAVSGPLPPPAGRRRRPRGAGGDPAASSPRRDRSSLWRLSPVAYIAVSAFPGYYAPLRPGLDASWMYALNYLAHSPYVFGRDVVFAYGPLGYLIRPLNLGPNLLTGTLFQVLLHLVFTGVVAYHAYRAASLPTVLLFTVGYAAVRAIGLNHQTELLLTAGALALLVVDGRAPSLVGTCLLAALSGVLVFVKPTLGVPAAGMLGVAALSAVRAHGARAWPGLVAGAALFLAVSLGLAHVLFPSVEDLALWLRRSVALASEYSVAMSLEGSRVVLALGLAALAAYGLLFVASLRRWPVLGQRLAVFLVPVLVAFKHGFVRQDAHVIYFFPFLSGTFSLLLLRAQAPAERKACAGALLAILVLSAPVAVVHPFRDDPWGASRIFGAAGWTNVQALLHFGEVARRLTAATERSLASSRLPDDWLSTIGSRTVDGVPVELSYLPANGLTWRPRPLLQDYLAFTPALDEWNAAHFADEARAPRFLIAEFVALDGRIPLLMAPATWRVILNHYDLAPVSRLEHALLLQRRSEPLPDDRAVVKRERARVGQEIPVPPSDGLLFVHLELRLRPLGVLSKAVLRARRHALPLGIER